MHIIYSAFRNSDTKKQQVNKPKHRQANKEKELRYQGYRAACHKYEKEIAAIRQYLPDWKPEFK